MPAFFIFWPARPPRTTPPVYHTTPQPASQVTILLHFCNTFVTFLYHVAALPRNTTPIFLARLILQRTGQLDKLLSWNRPAAKSCGPAGTRDLPACKIKLPASWKPRRINQFFVGISLQELGPQNSNHRFFFFVQELDPAQNREHQELGKADVPSSLFFGANSRGAKIFLKNFFSNV